MPARGAPRAEGRQASDAERSAMLKMLVRAGFLGALLVGLGAAFGLYADRGPVLWLHIALGLVFLVPAWLLSTTSAPRRRLVQAGAGLGTLGALLVIGRYLFWPGVSFWYHVVLMVLAIAFVEMGNASREARA